MPLTKNKLPPIGAAVKFRIEGGSTHLHEGTYTDDGFEHCQGFICYNTHEVDYWRALTPKRVDGRTD